MGSVNPSGEKQDWKRFADIVSHIEIGKNVLASVPVWIKSAQFKSVLVVSDNNTRAAAENLFPLLKLDGIRFSEFVFNDRFLKADEKAAAALKATILPEHNLLLGVGSGTINDICKYVGYGSGIPCAIVATAPSMDGYSAKGAAMVLKGMKVTPQTQCPVAIFCDIGIMKEAPMPMLASGLGDMLGKYNSLADWKLSNLLTGEAIPLELAEMMETAVRLCAESAEGLARRDGSAVTRLTEGLVLSGLAMSLNGDSRPASGAEHHLSHYWEMRHLAEGKETASHGLSVGVAALCAIGLWKKLPERPVCSEPEDRERTLELVKARYGEAAEALIPISNPNLPHKLIVEKWPCILDIVRELPEVSFVADLLRKVGAPLNPVEIGVDEALLRESILLARERKKVYTVLQLMGDIGLLPNFL